MAHSEIDLPASLGGGTLASTIIKGIALEPGDTATFWTVGGHDNEGRQLLGKKAQGFEFTCFLWATRANALTWVQSMANLRGHMVTVRNRENESFDKCVVKMVDIIERPVRHVPGSANIAGTDTRAVVRISGERQV